MKYDIATIGAITLDVFLDAQLTEVPFDDAPSGKALALPLGEKARADNALFTFGGNAANASATFAKNGFNVGIFACVGPGPLGDFSVGLLERKGVDVGAVRRGTKPTNFSLILRGGEGEKTILGYHGATDEFFAEDEDLEAVEAPWWYVSLAGDSYKHFSKIIDVAKKNDITVACNPSGRHIKTNLQSILDHLDAIDVLLLNNSEASALSGIDFDKTDELLSFLCQRTRGVVAMTLGKDGVVVSDGERVYRAEPFPPKEVVDTTGAGDAFGSGFVSVLASAEDMSEETIIEAIRFGLANSCSVLEHMGTSDGILSKEEFENDERFKELEINIGA